MKTKYLVTLALGVSLSTGAQAALFDRSVGSDRMVYDSTLNITWAADASLAQNSPLSVDGKMTWDGAVAWADSLVFGGHSDWRLPTLSLGAENPADNEMGHLLNVDLAGATNPFINIQDLNYWSGTQNSSTDALSFIFKDGIQSISAKTSRFYTWAVHSGDVKIPPVPVPAAIWLFGSGLIALLGVKRLGNIG